MYEPFAENTEASTATPRTPPTSRIALLTPEALPSSSGRTAESTTFATGAKKSAMPMPPRMKAPTSSVYGTDGSDTRASQPSAIACRARPVAISGRPPMRSESAPATGATNIGIAVHGSVLRPAPSGEWPWAVWRNCASRKIEPNIPKYMNSEAPFAAEKPRSRKSRSGTIGCAARRSQATNPASSTLPPVIATTIAGLVQPSPFPLTSPQTTPNKPALTSARPGRSRAPSGPLDSRSRSIASGSRTTPMGTLSQKIHCQEMPSTTAPPTSGPAATARPATPDQAPSATPRRSRGTASLRIVRLSGVTMAPPIPCTARAAISQSALGARAAAAEAVAERGAGEQEHRKGQRVGVHRPLELLDRGAEVRADHRKRRRDDEVVEDDHEEAERGDDERPDRSRPCRHRAAPFFDVVSHHLPPGEKRDFMCSGRCRSRRSGAPPSRGRNRAAASRRSR